MNEFSDTPPPSNEIARTPAPFFPRLEWENAQIVALKVGRPNEFQIEIAENLQPVLKTPLGLYGFSLLCDRLSSEDLVSDPRYREKNALQTLELLHNFLTTVADMKDKRYAANDQRTHKIRGPLSESVLAALCHWSDLPYRGGSLSEELEQSTDLVLYPSNPQARIGVDLMTTTGWEYVVEKYRKHPDVATLVLPIETLVTGISARNVKKDMLAFDRKKPQKAVLDLIDAMTQREYNIALPTSISREDIRKALLQMHDAISSDQLLLPAANRAMDGIVNYNNGILRALQKTEQVDELKIIKAQVLSTAKVISMLNGHWKKMGKNK